MQEFILGLIIGIFIGLIFFALINSSNSGDDN